MGFHEKHADAIVQKACQYIKTFEKIVVAGGVLAVVKEAYRALDKIWMQMSEEVSCSKGCFFCCHDKIEMSALEVMYLQEHVDFDKADRAGINAIIAQT